MEVKECNMHCVINRVLWHQEESLPGQTYLLLCSETLEDDNEKANFYS